MNKCEKCNIFYNNEIKFCKKCGTKLVHVETEEEKAEKVERENTTKNNRTKFRYIIGAILIIANISTINTFYGLIGILFGLSFFPIVYTLLKKIKKISENKMLVKSWSLIQILFPIILGVFWAVLLPEEPLEYISIHDENKIIAINEEYKIDFSTNLDDINMKDFEFISSNENIATIENGIIKGISSGKVTITIKGKNGIETSEVYNVRFIDIENIEIKGNTKLLVGSTEKLSVNITPTNTNDKIVKWTSSNPEVVSVKDDGVITANQKGVATITVVSQKGKSKSIDVVTEIPVDTLTINPNYLRLEIGKTSTLKLTITPDDVSENSIKWTSSNNNIAKVENGAVTAISEGKTTITAESTNGIKSNIEVEVYEIKAETITLNKSKLSLSVGKSATIKATIKPNDISDKSIEWTSSNSYVASVEDGKIIAKSRGTATIKATTSNGLSATVEVNVTEKAPIKITKFRYTKDSVCGIEWQFAMRNNSGKTINYVTLTWYNFNGVGDFVYDSINGKNYTKVTYTGPLKNGASTGTMVNSTKFYNCSYKGSAFYQIEIIYADGTSQTIKSSEFDEFTNLLP